MYLCYYYYYYVIQLLLYATSARTSANGFYDTHNHFLRTICYCTSTYFLLLCASYLSARRTRITTQNNNNHNIILSTHARWVFLRRFISYINRRFSTSTRGARTHTRKTYAPLRRTSCVLCARKSRYEYQCILCIYMSSPLGVYTLLPYTHTQRPDPYTTCYIVIYHTYL